MNEQLTRTARTTKSLSGRAFQYTYSSGMSAHIRFADDTVSWEITAGKNKGEKGENAYLAREIDDDIYLVQWYEPEINATVTLVINERAGSISSSEAYAEERVFDTAVIHNKS